MNAQKIQTLAKGERSESDSYYNDVKIPPHIFAQDGVNPRSSLIETTRKGNMSQNLFQILSKYIEVDQFVQGIAGVVRRVNNQWLGGNKDSNQNNLPADHLLSLNRSMTGDEAQ